MLFVGIRTFKAGLSVPADLEKRMWLYYLS
jgi:hypothetical protein